VLRRGRGDGAQDHAGFIGGPPTAPDHPPGCRAGASRFECVVTLYP
jgi:hypothetical protein